MSTVTITDVAKRVGVSVATISRYLSGFTVRNEEEIRDAIVELNYRPSAAARNLKSGRTGIIAIVVPDVTNPFFAAIVEGAESAVGGDRMILLVNTAGVREREEKALSQLFGRVDGIILVPATEDQEGISFFSKLGLPIVFVDRVTHEKELFSTVLSDNVKGAKLAVQSLIGHGHSRIAMISGPLRSTPGKTRADGYRQSMKAAKLPIEDGYFLESDFSEEGGYQSMETLLQLPYPPTAVFTANNLMTIGALRALRDNGVRTPEDISIIGFDDLECAELINPPISVIARDARLQGAIAMASMIKHLDEVGGAEPEHSMVDVQLVERGSCAPPRESQKIRSNKKDH